MVMLVFTDGFLPSRSMRMVLLDHLGCFYSRRFIHFGSMNERDDLRLLNQG